MMCIFAQICTFAVYCILNMLRQCVFRNLLRLILVVFFWHGSESNFLISQIKSSLHHFFLEIIFIQPKYDFIVLTFTITTFLPGK